MKSPPAFHEIISAIAAEYEAIFFMFYRKNDGHAGLISNTPRPAAIELLRGVLKELEEEEREEAK